MSVLLLKRQKWIPEFSSSLPGHVVLVRRIRLWWSNTEEERRGRWEEEEEEEEERRKYFQDCAQNPQSHEVSLG